MPSLCRPCPETEVPVDGAKTARRFQTIYNKFQKDEFALVVVDFSPTS